MSPCELSKLVLSVPSLSTDELTLLRRCGTESSLPDCDSVEEEMDSCEVDCDMPLGKLKSDVGVAADVAFAGFHGNRAAERLRSIFHSSGVKPS